MNTPRTGADGSPRSVRGRFAPRSVVTSPGASVGAGPGANAVLLLDEVLDGTSVAGAMNAPGTGADGSPGAMRRSPRSTRRSVVTGPRANAVLFFDEVLDGTSVAGAMNAPGADGSPGSVRRRFAPRSVVTSPRANAVLLFGQVFDGTSVTTEAQRRGAPRRRADTRHTASVVTTPAISIPEAKTIFLGGLVLSGQSQAPKANQNNLNTIFIQ